MNYTNVDYFYSYDIANILQVTVGSLYYAMRKLKIKGHLLVGDKGHRSIYTKEDVITLDNYFKDKRKDVEIDVDDHPLVTDKRFLKLSYFPDVRLSEDE